jgi:hypothetical protein
VDVGDYGDIDAAVVHCRDGGAHASQSGADDQNVMLWHGETSQRL